MDAAPAPQIAQPAPVAVAETRIEPVQQQLPEVATPAADKAERKPRTPRRPKAAKPIAVDLASAGLELVETRSDAPKAAVAEDKPAPRKAAKPAAWQKKAAAEKAADEPLVMIETQK
jgi:hypothetical protein